MSTDLGVCYYYTNQPDKALEQFDHSLKLDPKHAKTLLNVGIVRAFGKQDLDGATQAWQQVLQIAPDSPEGQAAKRALDSLQSGASGVGGDPEAGCVMLRGRCSFICSSSSVVARASGGWSTASSKGLSRPTPQPRPRSPQRGVQMVRDPVCGTFVLPDRALLDRRTAASACTSAPTPAATNTGPAPHDRRVAAARRHRRSRAPHVRARLHGVERRQHQRPPGRRSAADDARRASARGS